MPKTAEKKEYTRPKLFSRPPVAKFGDKPKQAMAAESTGWKSASAGKSGEKSGISIGAHREKREWKSAEPDKSGERSVLSIGEHRKRPEWQSATPNKSGGRTAPSIGTHRNPKWVSAKNEHANPRELSVMGEHRGKVGNPEKTQSLLKYETSEVSLGSLQSELNRSKKGGMFSSSRDNSQYFENVNSAISVITGEMSESLVGEKEEVWEKTRKIGGDYDKLIEACTAYCERNALTQKGQARQEIVQRILEQAKKDKAQLAEYFSKMSALPPSQRAQTLQDALDSGRRRVMSLPKEHQHLGGAASDVIKFKGSEYNAEMDEFITKNVYFKGEEVIAPVDPGFNNAAKKEHVFEVMANLQDKMKLPTSVYNHLVENVMNDDNTAASDYDFIERLKQDDLYKTNAAVHNFVDTAYKIAYSYGTSHLNLLSIGLMRDGKSANLGMRNVASSRLAKLLGAGDLIVDTEKATLDMGNGVTKNGILMQEAKGKDAGDFRQKIVGKALESHKKDGKDIKDFSAKDVVKSKITGDFQRSLADLQVLDSILDQGDRHVHNFLAEDKDGKLGAVQGIDNDFSFGKEDLVKSKQLGAIHGRSPLNSEGKMDIPYMSEKLRDNILAVTEEQIRFTLQDVLESELIDACWNRINQIQIAILLDMHEFHKNGGTNRYLKDDEWNEETLNAFMEKPNDSYMGRFINFASSDIKEIEINNLYQAGKMFWHDSAKEFNFHKLSETEAFLNIFAETSPEAKADFEYIKASGLLSKWCLESAALKRGETFAFENLPQNLRMAIVNGIKNPEVMNKLDSI